MFIKKISKRLQLNVSSNSNFHILRFLLIYALLSGLFYAYVGIISPGGKTYYPFLDHYLNIPAWFTWLITKCALALLLLTGFAAYQHAPNNITIMGSPGVTIIWACLGIGVMSFWIAFVSAHKATVRYKLRWIVIGIGLITGINIIRIALIALANHYSWKAFQAIEPHFAFNVVSYIAIFGLLFWFIKTTGRYYNISKPTKIGTPEKQV